MIDKLGIYAYFGYDLTPDERFSLIKSLGINNLGIWRAEDFMITAKLGEYEQTKLIEEHGFNISYAHAPIRLTPYLANRFYNREDTLKTYKMWIKGCVELKIPILVIHTPPSSDVLIENLKELADYATSQNIQLALENVEGLNPFDDIFGAIDNVYFCFDSLHAALHGDTTGQIVRTYKDRLVCTHLSDNDLKEDRHWMVGDGKIQWEKIAKNLNDIAYDGVISFEVFRSPQYENASSFLKTLIKRVTTFFK